MNIKFKNNVEDIEILLEYNYLNFFYWRIYYAFLRGIAIVAPSIVIIHTNIDNPQYNINILTLSLDALIIVVITLLIIYIFFKVLPNLLIKRLKHIACKQYKRKQVFLFEKVIFFKDGYIEVNYNSKRLYIPLNKNILVEQFKERIIISSVVMKNKIIKVYPLVIPITIFNTEKDKENFLKNIQKNTVL